MRHTTLFWLAQGLCLVAVGAPGAAEPIPQSRSEASDQAAAAMYRAVDVPAFEVKETPASEELAGRIRAHIRELANLGASSVKHGWAMLDKSFPPVPTLRERSFPLLVGPGIESPAALVELVKLGPTALPFLLENLDNKAPTRLVLQHNSGIGDMQFGHEISGNPRNPIEARVLGRGVVPFQRGAGSGPYAGRTYTVTVGDVCWVAIGQIVGRGYRAVRYQPTFFHVINSPTQDAELCRQVRDIWGSNSPSQHLLDSLLIDFSTRKGWTAAEQPSGPGPRAWLGESSDLDTGFSSRMQMAAAKRLLYYYLDLAAPIVAARLRGLDISPGITGSEARWKRERANGVGTAGFIEAVAWCDDPRIAVEIEWIMKNTTDNCILVACVGGTNVGNTDLFVRRCKDYFSRLQNVEEDPNGGDSAVLRRVARDAGKQAKSLLALYLRDGGARRRSRVLCALRDEPCEWTDVVLAPLLDNRQRTYPGWTYDPKNGGSRKQMRVCDKAAEIISKQIPGMTFELEGDYANLDRQIEAMKKRIAARDRE